ncbi:MAG: hypothetical protein WBY94_22095 [Polyangiaceae bacterium]
MSTIPVSSLFTPQTPAQWLAQCLADGQAYGLTTTSWQQGDPLLTMMNVVSLELSKEDALGISLRAMGGFLDFAASGSVTVTDINGAVTQVPVTPDPSIPAQNPTGALGLLDTLASSVYNVKRTLASAAAGPLYLANASGVSLGSFVAGTFHVQNAFTGATYSNQATFAFTPSVQPGTSVSTATATTPVSVTTSANHGLSTNAVVFARGLGVCADNFYTITVTGLTTFTLNGSIGAGSFPGPPPAPAIYTPQLIAFAADQTGPGGNAGIGQVNQLVTAAPKCYCSNLVTWAGAPFMSNATLATMCRAKLAVLSPNGPAGAYAFWAIYSYLVLSGQTVFPNPMTNATQLGLNQYLTGLGVGAQVSPIPTNITLDGGPVTRVLVATNTATGTVQVTAANASGGLGGSVNLSVSGGTTASPIVLNVVGHGCVTGDYGQVNGVQGLVGANGQWQLTFVDANHVSLNGSSGSGAYTSGGVFSGGDLYAVGAVVQAYATPNAVNSSVIAAGNVTITITATVYVPAAFAAQYATQMAAALSQYVTTFPIGGLNVDNQTNIMPIDAIIGILYSCGSNAGVIYTRSVANVTLNGTPNDLNLTSTGVAVGPITTGIVIVGQ